MTDWQSKPKIETQKRNADNDKREHRKHNDRTKRQSGFGAMNARQTLEAIVKEAGRELYRPEERLLAIQKLAKQWLGANE